MHKKSANDFGSRRNLIPGHYARSANALPIALSTRLTRLSFYWELNRRISLVVSLEDGH